jgi:hypothetical protein
MVTSFSVATTMLQHLNSTLLSNTISIKRPSVSMMHKQTSQNLQKNLLENFTETLIFK